MSWLSLTFIYFIGWGIWSFLLKVAGKDLSPMNLFLQEISGYILVMGLAFLLWPFKWQVHARGSTLAALAGLAAGIATLAFMVALSKGKVSVVVTISALYPAVTILLSLIFLKETLGLREVAGIFLAFAAMLLLAKP